MFCVYGQTCDIKGWTILPSSDGTRFTNDGTGRGMFVSCPNARTSTSTTQCQRPGGSAQLNTAPNPATVQSYQWPWWNQVVVVGRGGFGRR